MLESEGIWLQGKTVENKGKTTKKKEKRQRQYKIPIAQ